MKYFYLTLISWDPTRYYHSRLDLGVIAINEVLHISKVPGLESHSSNGLVSLPGHFLVKSVLPLGRDIVGVLLSHANHSFQHYFHRVEWFQIKEMMKYFYLTLISWDPYQVLPFQIGPWSNSNK